jgi:YD repeat-containing protein
MTTDDPILPPMGRVYGEAGRLLSSRTDQYWFVRTYDDAGRALTYRTDKGYWIAYTYDDLGNMLTCKAGKGLDYVYLPTTPSK